MKITSRDDARAYGLKKYFTGSPCKHGHVAERYVSTRGCRGCLQSYRSKKEKSEYNKQYQRYRYSKKGN